MKPQRRPRPVVLCVLDGWGYREETEDNAIAQARTPVWDRIWAECPHTLLRASASDVGLPAGQMGNSEVGHMSLGAGRVVLQDLPRIDRALADGSFAASPVLEEMVTRLKESAGVCHLMGLMSPGGVHSHQDQIAALARVLGERGVPVVVHAILDGRDTPPASASGHLERFEKATADVQGLRIGTVSGRYYTMDRDKRWDRTARAYEALVAARGRHAPSARAAVEASYAEEVTDEFVRPTVIGDYEGMKEGDGLLMANFRSDRVRQILGALLDPDFAAFAREKTVTFAAKVGMTDYGLELTRWLSTLFPPERLEGILAAVVAEAGLKQLRIAESEKYAHVTYFFSGGEERVFEGEERVLVPSPPVATYDLKPEMSAYEVTDKVVAAIESGRFDLIVLNYANADMVGHTGLLEAALKAAEAVDRCLGRLIDALERAGGAVLITADHGNIECMRDPATGQPHTAHTADPVPMVLVGLSGRGLRLEDGRLADVAPTLLALLGLQAPEEMTGRSLIVEETPGERDSAQRRAALA